MIVAPNPSWSAGLPDGASPVAAVATSPHGEGRLHLAYVDGLRAVAALYVLCVHVLPRAWGHHAPHSLALRLLAKVTSEGHFAVTAFIVISGFCLMLPVARAGRQLRGGAGVFFRRRFWRIAPPMYAAVALSVILLQLPGLRASFGYPQVTLRQLVAHLTLTQTLVPWGLVPNNGPLWSISVECVMYLFFPLLILLTRRLGMITTTALYVVAGYGLVLATRATLLAPATWQYLGAFALGALAADIAYGSSDRREGAARWRFPWYLLAAGSFGIIVAATAVFGWARVDRHVTAFDLPMAIATMALLVGASRTGTNPIRRALQWRPLAAVGLFSYSLYIIHYPLADVLERIVIAPIHNELAREAILIGVVVPILLGSAYVFYRLFEQPFHRLARRVGGRPDPSAPIAIPQRTTAEAV